MLNASIPIFGTFQRFCHRKTVANGLMPEEIAREIVRIAHAEPKAQAFGRRTGNCLSVHDGPNVALAICQLSGSTSWRDFRAARRRPPFEKGVKMLWTIAVILFVLWALGLATSYTMGGLVHILLILAVVTVVIRLIQGRRALP